MAKYLTPKNCAILKRVSFYAVWGLICAVSATGFSLMCPIAVRSFIPGPLFFLEFLSLDIRVEKEGL